MGAERIRQTIRQKETFGDARFWRFDENRYDWVDIGQLTRGFFPSPIWRLARKSNGQKFVCEDAKKPQELPPSTLSLPTRSKKTPRDSDQTSPMRLTEGQSYIHTSGGDPDSPTPPPPSPNVRLRAQAASAESRSVCKGVPGKAEVL